MKGTRGLYLPGAVTRIQKPAKEATFRDSQEPEGTPRLRGHAKAETPV